jgi:hypothetical protein
MKRKFEVFLFFTHDHNIRCCIRIPSFLSDLKSAYNLLLFDIPFLTFFRNIFLNVLLALFTNFEAKKVP